MSKAVITYDKDLPEISNRHPHKPPTAYLRKKPGTADDYEIVEGRRPSQMLLVNRLRKAVDKWRTDGYPGASAVAQRLFTYWFDEGGHVAWAFLTGRVELEKGRVNVHGT